MSPELPARRPTWRVVVNNTTRGEFGFTVKWAGETPGATGGETSRVAVPAGQAGVIAMIGAGSGFADDNTQVYTCWVTCAQPGSPWDGHQSGDNWEANTNQELQAPGIIEIGYDWNPDDFSHSSYFFSRVR